MKVETYACDRCHVQKKDVNHWFRAYKLMRKQGVVIIEWDATPTGDEVEDFEAHLCGANCVTEWLSKNLL